MKRVFSLAILLLSISSVLSSQTYEDHGDTIFWHGQIASASVATPPAGTRALFVNSATGELSVKTSAGLVVSLEGGGVGGGANVVEAEVDFGAAGDTTASVAVAATWVVASSVIVCSPTLMATTDRVDGAEDALIENLTVTPYGRSAGVGFSLKAHPAEGKATGKYKVHCTGV